MPTYDYRCERTGEMFELWQSFSDDALVECPQTHDDESDTCGAPVKKVFSKVGISFKGDGFYKNDHGSSSKKPSGDSASESSKNSSNDGESSNNSSKNGESSKNSSKKESSKSESSTSSGSTTTSSD